MVTFDPIDTQGLVNKVFKFNKTETPSYSQAYEDVGYDGSNFLASNG